MKRFLVILYICISVPLFAQKSYNMQGFELQLEELMNEIFSAESSNGRFAANEKFINVLEDALDFEKSFSYPFNKLDKISILTSKDKQFRIFTWSVPDDGGVWENFGFIQSKNSASNEYELYRLFDKSDEIISPEYEKLSDSTWFGAVYYELIEQKYDKRTYYVLLGWDGNDIYSRRRIIEPVYFKNNGSKPVFGQNVFYKDKDRMRYVFEYSTDANFTLSYGEQYYDIVTNQKAQNTLFHKAQPFETVPNKTEKEKMIFFDDLEPATFGMDGLKQYYVPSGEVIGLYFDGGKWKRIKYNVLPRNKAEKADGYQPDESVKHVLFPAKTKN
ncbi:MAG: hypothetical protein J6P44_00300 [Bacteroidales bacterium]|nr:hypothetical protein [Bacteroidales bacterium]